MAAFQFPALARDSNLRVLRPVSGANHDALKFEILEVRRGYAPPYTAVSYTWGDGKPSEVIYLNGKIFHVSVTLWSCLYYLCLNQQLSEWTHIWADAICINQKSDTEKSAQVRLMDETYRSAACVSVWLGLAPGAELWRLNTPEPVRTFDIEPFDWADHMLELANRPYWSRFWVIQEFLLGGNVNIYCSGNRVDWFGFKEILEFATKSNLIDGIDYLGAGNVIADSCAALPLLVGRHPDRHPEFFRPLSELLVAHHRSKSKDPRDRVFALLGLVLHDEGILLQRLLPDYSLSKEHVAIIAVAHVLANNLGDELLTVESDGLFLGLGIERGASRRKVLRKAKELDYIGCDELGYFLAQMKRIDTDERYGIDREDNAEEDPTPRSGTARGMMIILIAAILGLGVLMYWHTKQW